MPSLNLRPLTDFIKRDAADFTHTVPEPTMNLRIVRGFGFNGEPTLTLQQEWKLTHYSGAAVSYSTEWRNVPIVDGLLPKP
jgi:hypothetical protein